MLRAILLGSIGVLAETSELQRRAYNQALAEAGVSWEWDEETYAELLEMAGGRDRLALLGRATGQPFSDAQIAAIHTRKTELACAAVRAQASLRPGIATLVQFAKARGIALGLVTSTYAPNVEAILDAAGDALSAPDFAVIVTRDDIAQGKPAPDAYLKALGSLGLAPEEALAIEDTASSIASARRAGLNVVATPGAYTADQDFHEADLVMPSLEAGASGLDARFLAMIGDQPQVQLHLVQ
ncbi:MAG: HAD-IA family hydrolase [Pseudomonadota bacterium]